MQSTNKSIPNGDYQIYCLKLLILIAPNIHYLGINDNFNENDISVKKPL